MRTRLKLAEELSNLLPGWAIPRAVVAGSYAAVPSKAGDIDLWVLDTPKELFAVAERQIRQHNHGTFFSKEPQHFYGGLNYWVVGSTRAISGEPPVQIILTLFKTLEELVGRFDISTHAAGFSLLDPLITHRAPGFTTVNELPRVLNWEKADQQPAQTLDRLNEMVQRYGFEEPDLYDVERLEALIDRDKEENWDRFGPARHFARSRTLVVSRSSFGGGGRRYA